MRTTPWFPSLTALSFSTVVAACGAPPFPADGSGDDTSERSAPTDRSQGSSPDGGTGLLDAAPGPNAPADASTWPDALPPEGADLLGSEPHPTFSFTPSNVALDALDLERAPSAVLDCGEVRIDSTSMKFDHWCAGELPTPFKQKQKGGPEIMVIPLAGLTIEQGTALVLSGSRPVAFVVRGHVIVRGALDASAAEASPGPGGNLDCGKSAGGDDSAQDAHTRQGGTGGGFGTAGGAGGGEDGVAAGASTLGRAGVPRGTPELIPLIGGCPGGYAGGCVGREGGGGGALQISASGAIVVSGTVRVDGGAGARACSSTGGGTGGGSGGALLLEARALSVASAALSAAGGDGGPGANGAAPGAGAAAATEPGAPGGADASGAGAGGGGGFGRIQLRTPRSL